MLIITSALIVPTPVRRSPVIIKSWRYPVASPLKRTYSNCWKIGGTFPATLLITVLMPSLFRFTSVSFPMIYIFLPAFQSATDASPLIIRLWLSVSRRVGQSIFFPLPEKSMLKCNGVSNLAKAGTKGAMSLSTTEALTLPWYCTLSVSLGRSGKLS